VETLGPAQPMILEVHPPTPIIEAWPELPYERVNRYQVWQYVAPDLLGRYRPRVIFSPSGAYYLYNGEPYFYSPTRTLEFMSYASP
jgi:hypothetical protein